MKTTLGRAAVVLFVVAAAAIVLGVLNPTSVFDTWPVFIASVCVLWLALFVGVVGSLLRPAVSDQPSYFVSL